MSVQRISALLLVVTGLTAASGYARELSVAISFGAGRLTDAYFIASSIPMVLGDLFLGGALVASVVPTFSALPDSPQAPVHEARSLFNACLVAVVGLGVLTAVAMLFLMPGIIELLGPGLNPESQALAIRFGQWLVWLLPVNATITLISLVLNANRVFILPATTWLIVNLSFALIVLLGHKAGGENVLIWAALSGPALMLMLLTWRISRAGLLGLTVPGFSSQLFRKGVALARPMLLTLGVGSALGLLMISHVLLRRYGSTLGEGAVSALSYAFRVYEVPISLVAATAGTLALPAFSRLFHAKENAKMSAVAREMVSWGFLILLPTLVLTAMEADFLIRILFQGGKFSNQDAMLTASALRGFAPSILFETAFIVFFRIAYAIQRPGIAVTTGAASIVCLWLFLEIATGLTSLSWLAAALSASFAVAGVLSLALVGRVLGCRVSPTRREGIVTATSTLVAAIALAIWRDAVSPSELARSVIGIFIFATVYVLLVRLFLPDRWSQLLALMGRTRPA